MKIGMTSLTFREESVKTVINNAKIAGIAGIEWGVSDGHMTLCDSNRADKIKEFSEKNGIEIFSLGSYCRMQEKDSCDRVLETAAMLGAPIIRVWAGTKPPENADEEYFNLIVENTIYMATAALEKSIKIGFEFHENTLTQEINSAIRLVKSVNMKNVGLYWQPLNLYTPEENAEIFKMAKPYLVGNLHIHNFTVENGYQLLEEVKERLNLYYKEVKDENYNLMVEFVKDANLDNFILDVKTLKEVLE